MIKAIQFGEKSEKKTRQAKKKTSWRFTGKELLKPKPV